MSKPFIPSSFVLLDMIKRAEASFDAHRVDVKAARREELTTRGLARAARGRRYDEIQRGVVR